MNKLQLIDADTLYYKPLAHPKMLIDGVLSDGLAILAGDSKIGKSWMVLDLCLAVAQGEPFLGFPTRQHGTLYLALEDGKSRMQTRLRRLLEGRPAPANMHVMFQAQRLGEGLLETRTSIWSASIPYPRSSPRQSPLKMPTMPTTTTWAG